MKFKSQLIREYIDAYNDALNRAECSPTGHDWDAMWWGIDAILRGRKPAPIVMDGR